MGPLNLEAAPVLVALARVVLGIVALILAKFAKDLLSPYGMDRELTEHDNPAFGLAVAGYYGSVVIIYIAISRAAVPADVSGTTLAMGFGADLGWSLAGIAALAFIRWVMNAALLGGSHFSDTIVSGRNTAAGAVECGAYVSAGIALAGVLRTPGGSFLSMLVFFGLSIGVLLAYGRIYQRLAGYNVVSEIRSGNLAAGIALGQTLVAFALLLMKACSGEFIDWTTNLGFFAFDVICGAVMLFVLRWLTDFALLPNARIAEEIARDRNVNAGLIEGTIAVGVAALILFVF